MKSLTIVAALFGAAALAAPAPEPAPAAVNEGTFITSRDFVGTLQKRGCPAGSLCQNGKCSFYSCSSSGWCTWNPSSISC
ncbi:hypothetical protein QBC34DRAFT_382610 [Podospora aff. communis PSN243]|uniref:Uncharacterized protein n=1 Tax=Podospora aff. communis PSN243 TaxID=3040156 RepID=A0AAV9GIB0_9PEZI|nr:hypothetical protein QBC34DRAFT_382610 [Podospora aff. communis PSN243]